MTEETNEMPPHGTADKGASGGRRPSACSFSARVRPTINAKTGERRWAVQVWNGKYWALGVAREDGPQPAQKLRFRLRREANETAACINANPREAFRKMNVKVRPPARKENL